MPISSVCRGERDTPVSHRFDHRSRDYPQGVSVELSPLFDFSREPWILINHVNRQMIVAHIAARYGNMYIPDTHCTVLDIGANYGEFYALLRRLRKAKGVKFKYIGIDLDADKKIIAKQLRSDIDYRIMDALDISTRTIPELPVDIVVCAETLEHVNKDDGIQLTRIIYRGLKFGGYAIFTIPTPQFKQRRDDPFHLEEWKNEDALAMFHKLGFKIVDWFNLGVNVRDWSLSVNQSRIPYDMARATVSSMCPEGTPGNDGVYIVSKG